MATYSCDPELFEGKTEITVSFPKRRIMIKHKGVMPSYPASIGAEVDAALQEWYGALGLPVPADEVGVGALIAAANAEEEKTFLEEVAKAEEELPSVVPSYGTPEFWDYHRKKRALENARRAAEGLPPLPTKKELEAEKAKKRAEREAKKAAKAK